MSGWGIKFRVLGVSHGRRQLRYRLLGHRPREPGAGCRWPNVWHL